MTDDELDRALDVEAMTRGGIIVTSTSDVEPRTGSTTRDHRRVPREPRDRAEQVRRVPAHRRGVDARGGDPLGRRHRQPGLAAARAASRRAGPPTSEHPFGYGTRALLLGVRRRARAVQPGRPVRDLRRHREAAPPARARDRVGLAIGVLLVAIVLEGLSFRTALHESRTKMRGEQSRSQFIRRTKSPGAAGRAARGHRRARRPGHRAVRRHASPTSPTSRAGTRPAASPSASCSS